MGFPIKGFLIVLPTLYSHCKLVLSSVIMKLACIHIGESFLQIGKNWENKYTNRDICVSKHKI